MSATNHAHYCHQLLCQWCAKMLVSALHWFSSKALRSWMGIECPGVGNIFLSKLKPCWPTKNRKKKKKLPCWQSKVVTTPCFNLLPHWGQDKIDRLVQERCNSSANALELRLSSTNPLKWPPFYWWHFQSHFPHFLPLFKFHWNKFPCLTENKPP